MGRESALNPAPARSAKHRFLLLFAPSLAALFLRLLGMTWRVRLANAEIESQARRKKGQILYAFFHGNLLTPCYTHRGQGVTTLISLHGDGELIARTAQKLGFQVARGSSTRGGAAGLKGMCDAATRGGDLAMVTDGPRGPAGIVHRGSVALASITGLPVIPGGFAYSRAWRLRSWDRFAIPKPFARVAIGFGDPIPVPKDLGEEAMGEYQEKIRVGIEQATQRARAALGGSGNA